MGRAAKLKRARNQLLQGNQNVKHTDYLVDKIEREVRRLEGTALDYRGKPYKIQELREWPCQKSGHKVYLNAEIVPYTKDDGLLYYLNDKDKEELVVSPEWAEEQRVIKFQCELRARWAREAAVAKMEPTELGE